MNEIPKNAQGPSIPQPTSKIEQVKPEAVDAQTQKPVDVQPKEINEIPENPADRSAVKVDNLENDLKIFAANPDFFVLTTCQDQNGLCVPAHPASFASRQASPARNAADEVSQYSLAASPPDQPLPRSA